MYPAHTQLVAKWSSPSIGDQRATGWAAAEEIVNQAFQILKFDVGKKVVQVAKIGREVVAVGER